MRIKNNESAISLIVIGIILFLINAADIYFGYYKTHGKGFQISGIFLIAIGVIIWINPVKSN